MAPRYFLRNHVSPWLNNVDSSLGILEHLYRHVNWLVFKARYHSYEQLSNISLICVCKCTYAMCVEFRELWEQVLFFHLCFEAEFLLLLLCCSFQRTPSFPTPFSCLCLPPVNQVLYITWLCLQMHVILGVTYSHFYRGSGDQTWVLRLA